MSMATLPKPSGEMPPTSFLVNQLQRFSLHQEPKFKFKHIKQHNQAYHSCYGPLFIHSFVENSKYNGRKKEAAANPKASATTAAQIPGD